MSVLEAWKALVDKRGADFVGGDIEHQEAPEGFFRGPIASIQVKDDCLVVTTEWTAHLATNSQGHPVGGWRKVERKNATTFTYELTLDITSNPVDDSESRVRFTYPFSIVLLIPKDGSSLDRSKVSGL